MGTLLVALIVLALVVLAIRSIMKDQGGCSSCSGSCAKCHPSTKKGINKLVKESRSRHAS